MIRSSCLSAPPAIPAEADELQYAVPDPVSARRELPLRSEGFLRPFEVDEQSAPLADEMVVRGEIRVEPRHPSAHPRAKASFGHQDLQIPVDGPERHAGHRAPNALVHPLRSRMGAGARHGLVHESALARLAAGDGGGGAGGGRLARW